ncbi:MAG TPA: Lsr2 family protein [Acidimicrobiales bacterium]|nr:Lsr2 family protein [Acidimicrobiales bacterium]
MAKTVIVKLTDDLDGTDAEETVRFSLDGLSYEIDLNTANAAKLRDALGPFIARSVRTGKPPRDGSRPAPPASRTLFSDLTAEEKARFRAWANLPTARRIADARVQAWIDAGRA